MHNLILFIWTNRPNELGRPVLNSTILSPSFNRRSSSLPYASYGVIFAICICIDGTISLLPNRNPVAGSLHVVLPHLPLPWCLPPPRSSLPIQHPCGCARRGDRSRLRGRVRIERDWNLTKAPHRWWRHPRHDSPPFHPRLAPVRPRRILLGPPPEATLPRHRIHRQSCGCQA